MGFLILLLSHDPSLLGFLFLNLAFDLQAD